MPVSSSNSFVRKMRNPKAMDRTTYVTHYSFHPLQPREERETPKLP